MTKLQRRHYEDFAELIKVAFPKRNDRIFVVKKLAPKMQQKDDNFNLLKFLKAVDIELTEYEGPI